MGGYCIACDLKNSTEKNFRGNGGKLNMDYLLDIKESSLISLYVYYSYCPYLLKKHFKKYL